MRGLLFYSALLTVFPGVESQENVTGETALPWVYLNARQNRFNCGVNSLYMLLRLWGTNTSYDVVKEGLKADKNGISMSELRRVAHTFSLPCQVRRFSSVDQIERCNLPIIAHFNTAIMDSLTSGGHYVIVLGIDKNGVTLIDGTSGRVHRFKRDRFVAYSSGYILDTGSGGLVSVAQQGVLAVAPALLATSLAVSWLSRRKSKRKQALLLLMVLVSAPVLQNECHALEPSTTFRSSESDAINCVYMMLHYDNITSTYDDLFHSVRSLGAGGASLLDIARLLTELGRRSAVYRWDMDDLERNALPVVSYMDNARGENRGNFVLIHSISSTHCLLVRGGVATFEDMPIDQFRRHWSGFVVAQNPGRDSRFTWIALGPIAGLVLWKLASHTVRSESLK